MTIPSVRPTAPLSPASPPSAPAAGPRRGDRLLGAVGSPRLAFLLKRFARAALSLVIVPVVYEIVDSYEMWIRPKVSRWVTPREAPGAEPAPGH